MMKSSAITNEVLTKALNYESYTKLIEDLFSETHEFHKIYNHEGYLLLTPTVN